MEVAQDLVDLVNKNPGVNGSLDPTSQGSPRHVPSFAGPRLTLKKVRHQFASGKVRSYWPHGTLVLYLCRQ